MKPHERIIKQTAKKMLASEGLFQIGRSRGWLEDNGYYATTIEFQSSGYGQGSYLNAGISFLWESTKDMNGVLSFDYTLFPYTARVHENEGSGPAGLSYASYDGDDVKFTSEMETLAKLALERVIAYRKFRDLSFAKQALVKRVGEVEDQRLFWEVYHLAMFCFLTYDYEAGKDYLHQFMDILKGSFRVGDCHIQWHEDFYNDCRDIVLPQCRTMESAHEMVLDMIRRRRESFRSRSSYNKLGQMDAQDILNYII